MRPHRPLNERTRFVDDDAVGNVETRPTSAITDGAEPETVQPSVEELPDAGAVNGTVLTKAVGEVRDVLGDEYRTTAAIANDANRLPSVTYAALLSLSRSGDAVYRAPDDATPSDVPDFTWKRA